MCPCNEQARFQNHAPEYFVNPAAHSEYSVNPAARSKYFVNPAARSEYFVNPAARSEYFVIPDAAQRRSGIGFVRSCHWIPAFAGMTEKALVEFPWEV